MMRNFMGQFEDLMIAAADSTGLDVSTIWIPTRDSQKIRALLYAPEGLGSFQVVL